jgi:hypothetical protein
MERYKNLGGHSSVQAFELGQDSITVEFNDGAAYVYNCASTGTTHIDQMKSLALAGHGLNSYIMRCVMKAHAARLR